MKTRKAAIVGGGVIGGGWAARFLLSGWDVSIFDLDAASVNKINEVVANARRSLPTLSDVKMPDEGTLSFAGTLEEAVVHADWIQESVPERIEVKHAVLADIQAHCKSDALIGSSTSGFKPSVLQAKSEAPAQIFVAHPFNPVYLLPVVELVGENLTTQAASEILREIGMLPVTIEKEIDAHIADRLLEAVWREALWLVNDDIATTQQIDDIIRFGFGLRWAQMGLFETYRIAGGEGGMAHFIAQFGPCLEWPWTKLMDVPELTDGLVAKIADQSDAQSGTHSIRELERIRDDNLVAMMRALKGQDSAAGAVLNDHDKNLRADCLQDFSKPIVSIERTIPIDWTDYNGHMNESRYGQVFSDAGDVIMAMIGADQAYINTGLSYFTVEKNTKFIEECHASDPIRVVTHILQGEGKKLQLFHEMKKHGDVPCATCKQMLIHVSLKTRRSSEPGATIIARLGEIMDAQSALKKPEID